MREHMGLYCGKRSDNGEWVEGFYYVIPESNAFANTTFYMISPTDGYYDYEVDPETVGECSGVRDLNKKLIFEGDIVKFTEQPFGHVRVGVVCFVDGCFCIKYTSYGRDRLHRIGEEEQWQDMGASGKVTYQYEVIGNVVDNPELLQQEK